jgi:hypothetical protein
VPATAHNDPLSREVRIERSGPMACTSGTRTNRLDHAAIFPVLLIDAHVPRIGVDFAARRAKK